MAVQRSGYIGDAATHTDRNHFRHIAKTVGREGAIITTHDTPDVDGLGGAFALKRYLEKPGSPVDLVTFKTIQLTDPLVERLKMRLRDWRDIDASESRPLIVVDTGTPSLLSGCDRTDIFAVIDHHPVNNPPLNATYKITGRTVAGCEIIASLIPGEAIDPEMALALAVGIAGDSEKLDNIGTHTLTIFKALVAICREDKKTIDLLAYPPLKAEDLKVVIDEMRYLRMKICRDKLIAVGQSHLETPAIMATILKDMGVSVTAILYLSGPGKAANENVYKVSYRVRSTEAKAGVHACDIATEVSRRCGMPQNMLGGGHMDKAAAFITGAYNSIVDTIFTTTKEAINKAFGRNV